MSFLVIGSPIGRAPAVRPSGPKWAVSQHRVGVCTEAGKQCLGVLSEMRKLSADLVKLSADLVEVGRVRCFSGLAHGRGKGCMCGGV